MLRILAAPLRAHPWAALSLAALLLVCPLAPAQAAPEEGDEAPAGPAGPTFRNPSLGVEAKGPAGWRMTADKVRAVTWQRLVTFWDPDSSAEAVISRRTRTAGSVQGLHAAVKKDWRGNAKLVVSGMQLLEPSEIQKQAAVIVDATEVVRAKAASPDDPPPAPETWRIQATYVLSPGYEYLIYVKAKATHWSRIRSNLKRLRTSLRTGEAEQTGPTGAGTYRSDRHAFRCRYPVGYSVVQPPRKNHVVQFTGTSAEQPSLSVYRIPWEADLDEDVKRLVDFYREELGGEAEVTDCEVAGKPGMCIVARARIGGRDQVVHLAIVKRGKIFFRLKASADAGQSAACAAAFKTFVDGFGFQAR